MPVWDNVRYHHSSKVRDQDEQLDIGCNILAPPYSPDLMPVERLWSWLRQELTYLHYCHADPAEFVDRIAAFVEHLLDTPWQGTVHEFTLSSVKLLAPERSLGGK